MRNILAFAMSCVVLFSCGDPIDIDDIDPPVGSVNFEAVVDGEDFESPELFTNAQVSESPPYYAITVGGLEIQGADTIALVIAMFGQNFDDLEAGDSFSGNGTVLDSLALGVYSRHNPSGGFDIDASSEFTDVATVSITALDKLNQLISGTFSYTALDDETSASYVVTEGEFSNVEY